VSGSAAFEDRLLGQTLAGRYRLVEVMGGGCFGVVFRADQYFCRQLVRPVAVKVTRQTGLTEDTAPLLFSDALVLARVLASGDHDGRRHLVQIFDMGLLPEHDDRAFMVMEYVDGRPLLSHMRAAGRFSVGAGLRFLKQACKALAFIHAQGVVHRDLIPSNILVDQRGLVRVVDFGLAAYTDHRLGFVPGAEGVYCYMAPETLLGRSTPASDVYSLGLILYELFTGDGPHLHVHWNTEQDGGPENHRVKTGLRFTPPSTIQNEIRNDHRWLDTLIACCLDPEPARRYADASQLLAAVEAAENGLELPLPTETAAATSSGERGGVSLAVEGETTSRSETPELLFREVRRLLANRAWEQVIDRLDIHRPPEWAALDQPGARTLRALAQAYLGQGDLPAARDCLEQLRAAQREQKLLSRSEHAAALSDLFKCYRGLGLMELARACQEEARGLL
jgi:serine/threonine protein kinase